MWHIAAKWTLLYIREKGEIPWLCSEKKYALSYSHTPFFVHTPSLQTVRCFILDRTPKMTWQGFGQLPSHTHTNKAHLVPILGDYIAFQTSFRHKQSSWKLICPNIHKYKNPLMKPTYTLSLVPTPTSIISTKWGSERWNNVKSESPTLRVCISHTLKGKPCQIWIVNGKVTLIWHDSHEL